MIIERSSNPRLNWMQCLALVLAGCFVLPLTIALGRDEAKAPKKRGRDFEVEIRANGKTYKYGKPAQAKSRVRSLARSQQRRGGKPLDIRFHVNGKSYKFADPRQAYDALGEIDAVLNSAKRAKVKFSDLGAATKEEIAVKRKAAGAPNGDAGFLPAAGGRAGEPGRPGIGGGAGGGGAGGAGGGGGLGYGGRGGGGGQPGQPGYGGRGGAGGAGGAGGSGGRAGQPGQPGRAGYGAPGGAGGRGGYGGGGGAGGAGGAGGFGGAGGAGGRAGRPAPRNARSTRAPQNRQPLTKNGLRGQLIDALRNAEVVK